MSLLRMWTGFLEEHLRGVTLEINSADESVIETNLTAHAHMQREIERVDILNVNKSTVKCGAHVMNEHTHTRAGRSIFKRAFHRHSNGFIDSNFHHLSQLHYVLEQREYTIEVHTKIYIHVVEQIALHNDVHLFRLNIRLLVCLCLFVLFVLFCFIFFAVKCHTVVHTQCCADNGCTPIDKFITFTNAIIYFNIVVAVSVLFFSSSSKFSKCVHACVYARAKLNGEKNNYNNITIGV